ncbi:MAG: hypothetical protein GXY74_04295 [Phycisphaerae bacterium]|nr:hypothetical protein [Phycisphaerae bacterium]
MVSHQITAMFLGVTLARTVLAMSGTAGGAEVIIDLRQLNDPAKAEQTLQTTIELVQKLATDDRKARAALDAAVSADTITTALKSKLKKLLRRQQTKVTPRGEFEDPEDYGKRVEQYNKETDAIVDSIRRIGILIDQRRSALERTVRPEIPSYSLYLPIKVGLYDVKHHSFAISADLVAKPGKVILTEGRGRMWSENRNELYRTSPDPTNPGLAIWLCDRAWQASTLDVSGFVDLQAAKRWKEDFVASQKYLKLKLRRPPRIKLNVDAGRDGWSGFLGVLGNAATGVPVTVPCLPACRVYSIDVELDARKDMAGISLEPRGSFADAVSLQPGHVVRQQILNGKYRGPEKLEEDAVP